MAFAGLRPARTAHRPDPAPAVHRVRSRRASVAARAAGRRGRARQDHRGRPDPAPPDPDRARAARARRAAGCAGQPVVGRDAAPLQPGIRGFRRRAFRRGRCRQPVSCRAARAVQPVAVDRRRRDRTCGHRRRLGPADRRRGPPPRMERAREQSRVPAGRGAGRADAERAAADRDARAARPGRAFRSPAPARPAAFPRLCRLRGRGGGVRAGRADRVVPARWRSAGCRPATPACRVAGRCQRTLCRRRRRASDRPSRHRQGAVPQHPARDPRLPAASSAHLPVAAARRLPQARRRSDAGAPRAALMARQGPAGRLAARPAAWPGTGQGVGDLCARRYRDRPARLPARALRDPCGDVPRTHGDRCPRPRRGVFRRRRRGFTGAGLLGDRQ